MTKRQTFHVAAFVCAGLLVAGCPPDADDSPDAGTMEDGTSGEDDAMSDDGGSVDGTAEDGGSAPRFEVVDCTDPGNAGANVTVGPGKIYEPSDVTISSGDVVRWVWASDVQLPHDVVADEDSDCSSANPDWFASEQTAGAGETFCVQFNEAGSWNYQCTVGTHCEDGMKGTVTVEDS